MKKVAQVFLTLGIAIVMTLSMMIAAPTIVRTNAIYDAVTLVDLNIARFSSSSGILSSKLDDLLITGDAFVDDEGAIIEHNAFADQSAGAFVVGINPDALGIHDGLSQEAIATGEAVLGVSASFALTQDLLAINNFSLTESYTIESDAIWSYFVNTEVTNSRFDFAATESENYVESLLYGSLLDLTVGSDSDFGGGIFTDHAVLPLSIMIPPGTSDILTLTTNAIGVASAILPVSESSILTVFFIDFLSAVFVHRRSRPFSLKQTFAPA